MEVPCRPPVPAPRGRTLPGRDRAPSRWASSLLHELVEADQEGLLLLLLLLRSRLPRGLLGRTRGQWGEPPAGRRLRRGGTHWLLGRKEMHGHRLQAPERGEQTLTPDSGLQRLFPGSGQKGVPHQPRTPGQGPQSLAQGQPQEQPCPFPSFRSLLHLALGCPRRHLSSSTGSELPEAGCVAWGSQWPLWSKPKDGASQLCGATHARLASVARRPCAQRGEGETLSWAQRALVSNAQVFWFLLLVGTCSWCPSCSWWLRAGATVGLGLGSRLGWPPNTRGLATIIRVRTMQRATCSQILYSSVMTVVLTNQRPREINKPACALPMKLAHTAVP